jgi:hypothetical protein
VSAELRWSHPDSAEDSRKIHDMSEGHTREMFYLLT